MDLIDFTLDHKPVRFAMDDDRALLSVPRTHFGFTGTKFGNDGLPCIVQAIAVADKRMRG